MGSKGTDQSEVCRKFKVQNSAITWLGDPWICPEQLKRYPALLSNGKMIAVRSFVLIMNEDGESHYLGYLEDLYEDTKGEKKAEVRWFRHNQEVKEVIPHLNTHPEEVLITPDIQVISAEYIDQVGTVLSPKHYDKSLELSENLSSGIFLCHREFKKDVVRPFSVSKLRGYTSQRIFSLIDCRDSSKNKGKLEKSNKEKEEFPQKLGGHPDTPNSEPRELKLKLSKGPGVIKLVGSDTSQSSALDEKNIELLCQDSGIRGCWHRCKILKTLEKRIKVQYYDLLDVCGPGKLEEWVPASRVAAPDKLNMRCAGRLTVRPWPPKISDRSFKFGDAVDAWLDDGWWECVVLATGNSESENVLVYQPGESRILNIQKKDLRISRDWVNDKWIDIEPKTDVLSFVASPTGTGFYGKRELKRSTSSKASKHVSFVLPNDEAPKDGLKRLAGSVTTTELTNVEKQLLICDSDHPVDKDSVRSNEDSGQNKAGSESVQKHDRRQKRGRKPKQQSQSDNDHLEDKDSVRSNEDGGQNKAGSESVQKQDRQRKRGRTPKQQSQSDFPEIVCALFAQPKKG